MDLRWLDENLPLISIPYLVLGLGIAFLASIEAAPGAEAGPSAFDYLFLVGGHLLLAPTWLWLFRRYSRAKSRRVHQLGYLLPAASYLIPALIGIARLVF